MNNGLRVAEDVRQSILRTWSRRMYCSSSISGMHRSGHRGLSCVWGKKTRVPTNHQTVKVGGVVVPYHYMFTTYTVMLQHAQFGK